MRIFYNVKLRNAMHLKFVGTFLTSLTKLVFEVKAYTCSKIKEHLLLYCRKFLTFIIVLII